MNIYLIVPYADITDEMIEKTLQTSRETLRHSCLSPDRVILKVSNLDDIPSSLDRYRACSYRAIKQELKKADWIDPRPIDKLER